MSADYWREVYGPKVEAMTDGERRDLLERLARMNECPPVCRCPRDEPAECPGEYKIPICQDCGGVITNVRLWSEDTNR